MLTQQVGQSNLPLLVRQTTQGGYIMQIRKKELTALKNSAVKLDALIAASRGDESSCAVFGSHNGNWTDEQKRAVRVYVETWIGLPLKAAIAGIDGDRSVQNDSILDHGGL